MTIPQDMGMKVYYEYHEYRPHRYVILKNRRVVSKASGSEFNWKDLDLNSIRHAYIEYRPGLFLRLHNGKIKGKVSKEQLIWEELDLEGYTNIRNVGILFGLAALTWLLTILSSDPLSKAFFIVGYICFSVLFLISHAVYITPKMKLAGIEYLYRRNFEIHSKINYLNLFGWVFSVWFVRRLLGVKYPLYFEGNYRVESSKEFGYLLLFWIMVLFFGIFLPFLAYFLITQITLVN